MDIAQKVAALKQRSEEARTRHARALAGIAVTEDRASQVTELLKSEFGVSTLEEAKTLLVQLREQAGQEADDVERLLVEAGGAA